MDATPFGQYQLQELIGRGGMGEVYRAFDTRTDRIVALKFVVADAPADGPAAATIAESMAVSRPGADASTAKSTRAAGFSARMTASIRDASAR